MPWGRTLVRVAVDVVADGLSVSPKNKLSVTSVIRSVISLYVIRCPAFHAQSKNNADNYKPIKIVVWALIDCMLAVCVCSKE
jgi:hypothetical protein